LINNFEPTTNTLPISVARLHAHTDQSEGGHSRTDSGDPEGTPHAEWTDERPDRRAETVGITAQS